MPGVFKTLIFCLAARPDLGLICTSNPFGIDNAKPVGIIAVCPGLILILESNDFITLRVCDIITS